MTLQEFKEKHVPEYADEANFNALVRFCINFDIDWMHESYEECRDKLRASMRILSEDVYKALSELAAKQILVSRYRKL